MPSTAVAAVGVAGSLWQGKKAADANADARERALDQATTQISPFQFIGPGGISGGFGQPGAGTGTGIARPGGPGGLAEMPEGILFDLNNPSGHSAGGTPIFDAGLKSRSGKRVVLTGDNANELRLADTGEPFRGDFLVTPDGTEVASQTALTGAQRGMQALRQHRQSAGNQVFGDLGELNPAFNSLVGLANQGLSQAATNGGLPPALQAALARAGQPLSVARDGTLNSINQGVGNQFARALAGTQTLQDGGFQRGLQAAAFGGAQEQVNRASQGFDDVFSNTLSTLREQAQPFEEREFQDLQENLFSTGRLGTSGGALQTEAFARGLAQADTERQLQARQEARRVQDQTLTQAQGLAGIGQQTRGLEEDLLNSAFGRFANTAEIGADVAGQRFRENFANVGLLQEQSQNNFGNVLRSLQAGRGLRQADLDFALNALQGQGALFDQSLKPFEAALAAAQAKANAEIGAGSNVASIVGNSNFGGGNEILQDAFTGLAENSDSIVDTIGGLFGGDDD